MISVLFHEEMQEYRDQTWTFPWTAETCQVNTQGTGSKHRSLYSLPKGFVASFKVCYVFGVSVAKFTGDEGDVLSIPCDKNINCYNYILDIFINDG